MNDPEIGPAGWDLETLRGSEDIVCILDASLRIQWTNEAWSAFANHNGGAPAVIDEWSRDTAYADAIPEPLRKLYDRRFQQCLENGQPWSHEYECSSPELYRVFHQTAYPVDHDWIVVVNSLTIEKQHQDRVPVTDFREEDYQDVAGYHTPCMHCRRTRHAQLQRWDWIPDWVEKQPERTQVLLCPPCFDFYHPAEEEAA